MSTPCSSHAVNPVLPSPYGVQVDHIRNTSFEITWETKESALITGFEVRVKNVRVRYSVGRSCRSVLEVKRSDGVEDFREKMGESGEREIVDA